jgi:hypothetical protein
MFIVTKFFKAPRTWTDSLARPKQCDHWEELGVGERIILRWTLGRWGSMGQTGLSWLRIGSGGGLL